MERVRRRRVPAQGPQGQRLPARSHPRGDVHPRGQGPVLLLQGPAGLALPDPDEVPRRGASPRRRAARTRVRDEGLLLLRRLRRRSRGLLRGAPGGVREDLRPARLRLRHRQGHFGGDGRLEVRGVPGHRRERRGHLRPLQHLRLRRQRGGRAGPGAPAGRVRRRARRARRADPGHAHHRDARRPPQRGVPARGPALDGRRHPEERDRRAQAPRRHPRADRHRPARRPRGRREAPRGPARAHRGGGLRRGRLQEVPVAGQGLHRPGGAGGEERVRHPLPGRPADRRGHPLGHRRRRVRLPRARPRGRPGLHARRHHRGRRGPRRRPVPQL